MPAQRSKQRSRKRRSAGAAPRAVPSQRRAERAAAARPGTPRRVTGLDARGPRPEGPFGGLPVSELAIFAGAVAVVVGFLTGGGVALVVGIAACGLGVLEVTAREHFSGYRSHALLLAAYPAVGTEVGLVAAFGSGQGMRPVLIAVVVPLFVLLAWLLRSRYRLAHHARSLKHGR